MNVCVISYYCPILAVILCKSCDVSTSYVGVKSVGLRARQLEKAMKGMKKRIVNHYHGSLRRGATVKSHCCNTYVRTVLRDEFQSP